jgi:hypothetical protein
VNEGRESRISGAFARPERGGAKWAYLPTSKVESTWYFAKDEAKYLVTRGRFLGTRLFWAKNTQHMQEKDTYFVAVKVFLEKDGKFLVMKDNFGDWDLPGGRIKKDEFEAPLENIIARKMQQELGPEVRYVLGNPLLFLRHERVEAAPGNPTVRIFAVGYPAVWESGEIELSERHTEMLWADPKTFKPEQYFKGGWLKGVQEYLSIRNS